MRADDEHDDTDYFRTRLIFFRFCSKEKEVLTLLATYFTPFNHFPRIMFYVAEEFDMC